MHICITVNLGLRAEFSIPIVIHLKLTGIIICTSSLSASSALVASDDGVVLYVDLPDEVGSHLVQAGVIRLATAADLGDTAAVTSLVPHAEILLTGAHFDET